MSIKFKATYYAGRAAGHMLNAIAATPGAIRRHPYISTLVGLSVGKHAGMRAAKKGPSVQQGPRGGRYTILPGGGKKYVR